MLFCSPRSNRSRLQLTTVDSSQLANAVYENISSKDFILDWSKYDDVYITTNSDYIRPALANPHQRSLVQSLNISSREATQAHLFPLLFEILFRPTDAVSELVDDLLQQRRYDNNLRKQLLGLHIRMGQNPSMTNDARRPHRDTIVADIVRFVETNLTVIPPPLVFITSDSATVNEYIRERYGPQRTVSIAGPIIHIDRLLPSHSFEEQCHGFLKAIADFYVLGECDMLVVSRSGFSDWASRRRHLVNPFDHLYMYCQGVHRVTGGEWRRPHVVC